MLALPLMLAAISNGSSRTESIICLNNAIETYFLESTLLLVSPSGAAPLKHITAAASKAIILYEKAEPGLTETLRNNRYDILIYRLTDTEDLERMFDKSAGNLRGRILLTMEEAPEGAVRGAISTLWNLARVTDVTALVSTETSVDAYVWFPYRAGECTTVASLTLVDQWRSGFFESGSNLFPRKMSKDLNGCEVLASTRPIEPYVFTPRVPEEYESGYEVWLMEELASGFNLSLRYVSSDPVTFWTVGQGGIKHGSVFEGLLAHNFDVAFGGMMAREDRFQLAGALYPHMVEYLVWMYPKPGVKTNFSSIYVAFSSDLWLLVISFHVFVAFAFFLVNKGAVRVTEVHYRSFSTCFFNSLAILCNTTVPYPKTDFLRFMVITYFIHALHLGVAYQSYLIVLLTHFERYKPVNDFGQLVDMRMTALLFTSGQFWYNRSDHETWDKVLLPGGHKYIDGLPIFPIINDIAVNRTSFLLFPKSSLQYLTTLMYPDRGESLFDYLTFFTYPLTIYVSPGNPLQEMFSNHIHALIQTGIYRKWRQDILLRQESAHLMYNTSDPQDETQSLSIQHLEGAFLMWFLSLTLSSFVFVGEILLHKCRTENFYNEKLRRLLPVIKYFSRNKSVMGVKAIPKKRTLRNIRRL